MSSIRTKIKGVLFTVIAVIIFILIARVFIDLVLSQNSSNPFVSFINTLSNPLISPFNGVITITSSNLNFDAVIALSVYVLGGIAITEFVAAFFYDSVKEIGKSVINALFKVVEFILILRFILDFFLVDNSSTFAKNLFKITNWSENLLSVSFLEDRIHMSIVLVFLFIIIIDILKSAAINKMFGLKKKTTAKSENAKEFGEIKSPMVIEQKNLETKTETMADAAVVQPSNLGVPEKDIADDAQKEPVSNNSASLYNPEMLASINKKGYVEYHEGKVIS